MAKRRQDLPGCGCLQCRNLQYNAVERSFGETISWSVRLVLSRPTILIVFFLIGGVQFLFLSTTDIIVAVGGFTVVLGILVARGYVAVIGRANLAGHRISSSSAFKRVFVRLPRFLVALMLVTAVVIGAIFVIRTVVTSVFNALGQLFGVGMIVGDVVAIVVAIAVLIWLLIKFCFVPDACFVGGYGPLASLGVSWELTTVHRWKAVALAGGLLLLLAASVVLDTTTASPASSLSLSVQIGETTVVIRSVGLSVAGITRFLFDVLLTAIYSGVFLHQYVQSIVSAS